MSRPHNCRHCSFMVCGDVNWCSEHEETMTDMQICMARKCPEWEWNAIDALTLAEWEPTPPRKHTVLDGQTIMEVDESRYTALFGTPERAARTLYESTSECRCCTIRKECGYNLDKCVMYDHDQLLEWLRSDVK